MFIFIVIFHVAVAENDYNNLSLACSPWSLYHLEENACKCPDDLTNIFHCNRTGYIDAVETCTCATYNEKEDLVEAGYCLYGCHRPYYVPDKFLFHTAIPANKSEWNNLQCGPFNRMGTLCGSCQNGLYMRAYSFNMECISCDNYHDWWKYILSAFLPVTVFYILMLIYPVNLSSSSIFGLVFFSQMVSAPAKARLLVMDFKKVPTLLKITKVLMTFYGIWNFDFFRSYSDICLQIDSLTILSLDLIVAIYPIFLIIITYLVINTNINVVKFVKKRISSYFSKRGIHWNTTEFTMKCYATFILLFYVKLLNTCLDLLTPVTIYQFVSPSNITSSTRLYYDATVPYLGSKHRPYAIAAILMLLILEVTPIIILFLFSFKIFQRCLNNLLPQRWQIFLRSFVDYFQGCFKNGTEPNCKDCRWFSSVPFMFHFLSCLVFWRTSDALILPWNSILALILVISIIVYEPFKNFKLSYNLIAYNVSLVFVGVGGSAIILSSKFKVAPNYTFLYVIVAAGSLPMLHTIFLVVQFIYYRRRLC